MVLSEAAEHESSRKLLGCADGATLEAKKTEWIPSVGYMTRREAMQDVSYYLMERYNWIRPHQFNDGLALAVAEEKLKTVSEFS